jgi:hypothetical protein
MKTVWASLALAAALMAAAAKAEMQVVSEVRGAPANYHQTYSEIQNTVLSIEDFYLRTSDGKVIKVVTGPMNVDFQDLKALKRGLEIDTTKTAFPQNVPAVEVVEVETRVTSKGPAYINFVGGAQCKLTAPKLLNFFTKAPAQMGKDIYLIKIDFSALNAIQLDSINQGSQEVEECNCIGSIFGGGRSCDTRGVGKIRYRRILKCELVNRRHAITDIVRKAEDI